jgi:tripartite-type tricarboxylate transporter receptor subunit TctC
MKKARRLIPGLIIAAILGLFVQNAAAQSDFPNKTVTIYCPWSAGGSTDLTSRMIANKATEIFGVPVIVANKTGGGGYVANTAVYRAKPDGYTIVVNASSTIVLAPHLRDVPIKPLELTPVMSYGIYPFVVAVKEDSPIKTFKDLVEMARKNPGKVTLATSGPDAMENLAMFMLEADQDVKFKFVPFEGGAPAVAATLGGHVDAFIGVGEPIPHIREGTMRGLVTFLGQRMAGLPDIPTLKELGYNIVVESRLSFFGPPGLPNEIVTKLQDTFKECMNDKGFKRVAESFEVTPSFLNSSELDQLNQSLSGKIKEVLIRIGRIKG